MGPFVIAIPIVYLVLHAALGLIEYERIAASGIVPAEVGFSRKASPSLRLLVGVIAVLLHINLNVMFVLRTSVTGVPIWLFVASTTSLLVSWLVKSRENNKEKGGSSRAGGI